DRWGSFTPYSELIAEDRIYTINSPLMKSPEEDSTFETEIIKGKPKSRTKTVSWSNPFASVETEVEISPDLIKETKVTFHWDEPLENVGYFLEIYPKEDASPLKPVRVKNGKATLKLRDLPTTIWWRIFAQSAFGNKS